MANKSGLSDKELLEILDRLKDDRKVLYNKLKNHEFEDEWDYSGYALGAQFHIGAEILGLKRPLSDHVYHIYTDIYYKYIRPSQDYINRYKDVEEKE